MVWSAALGLAGKGIGAIGASSAARQQARLEAARLAYADKADQRQLELANQNMALARDQLGMERELYDWTLEQNAYNRGLELDQRDYGRNLTALDRLQAQREYDLGLDRTATSDREMAAERVRQLTELLSNRNLRQSERQRALEELQRAQQIAAGERQYDIAQFERARGDRQAEREWQISQLRESRDQAGRERQYDIDQRNLVMQRTEQLARMLDQAYQGMGTPERVEYLGAEDVDRVAGERLAAYTADVDRAATIASSQNEAALMRGGLDESTPGTARRADVAARLAPEYMKARTAAADDAIRYITGVNQQLSLGQQAEQMRRQMLLGEISGTYGQPIEMMMRAPNVRSALAGPDFTSIGSGMYDRSLLSAGSYQSPLNVGSAVDEQAASGVDLGFSGGFGPQRAQIGPYNFSGAYTFSSPGITNPSAFSTAAMQGYGNVATGARNAADRAGDRAAEASRNAGGAFMDFAKDATPILGGWLDKKFPIKRGG